MDKNVIIVVISVLVVAVAFYYVEENNIEEQKLSAEELYNLGTLNTINESGALIGCTDPDAQNYNPDATYGYNHNCYYNAGCCDVTATNYDANSDSCSQTLNNSIMCIYS